MKKVRIIISVLLLLLGISTMFFNLLFLSKIGIGIAILFFIIFINITNEKILLIKKFVILAFCVTIPIMYLLAVSDYKMFIERIVFEKIYDNVTCTFDNYDAIFYIDGIGPSPSFNGQQDLDWKEYRRGIQKVVISDGITKIGKTSFCNSPSLIEVFCPDSVEIISEFSFMGCSKLYKFNTDRSFTIVIPKETRVILDSAFYGCDRIKYVYLYKNIEFIDTDVFNLSNLTDVYFEGSKEEWDNLFIADNSFPENVTFHFNEEF